MGSLVGDTCCISIDPIISEAIDTGPTARSLELPSTAYTSGGTKLESTHVHTHTHTYMIQSNIYIYI